MGEHGSRILVASAFAASGVWAGWFGHGGGWGGLWNTLLAMGGCYVLGATLEARKGRRP